MIKHSHRKNSIWHGLLMIVVICLVGCGQISDFQEQGKIMTKTKMTLWQAIEVLAEQVPFSKNKVEAALSVHLVDESGDYFGKDVSQYFKSAPVELSNGVLISNVDLRIKRTGQDPGFMVLEIGDACVTLEQVREHYGALQITQAPRGSLADATSYSTWLSWGKLSFSFAESNPRCLSSIVFDPKKE